MLILIAMNHKVDAISILQELSERLSIINFVRGFDFIQIDLDEFKSINIIVKPALADYVKGIRPDYYLTDSLDVHKYYKYSANVKRLSNLTELVNVVLTECKNMNSEDGFLD